MSSRRLIPSRENHFLSVSMHWDVTRQIIPTAASAERMDGETKKGEMERKQHRPPSSMHVPREKYPFSLLNIFSGVSPIEIFKKPTQCPGYKHP